MAQSEETIRALLRARSALLADVDLDADTDDGERLLVRSDLPGTMQLYEFDAADGLVPLTDLTEPVGGAWYVPGGRTAVLEVDAGGNERYGLHRLVIDRARERPVRDLAELDAIAADPRFGHHFAGVSRDGTRIAYTSNRGNGVDFDLWLCELATGAHRCLYAGETYGQPGSGFSPDGRFVSVLCPGERSLDDELVLVEVATGEARTILSHPDEPALVTSPAWTDSDGFWFCANVGCDFLRPRRYDLRDGTTTPVSTQDENADAQVIASRDGSTILIVANHGGGSALSLHDASTGEIVGELALPEPGVVANYAIRAPILAADGSRVFCTVSSPRSAGDVYVLEPGREPTRLTHSPTDVEPRALAPAETHEITSSDDVRIPLFVFRPDAGADADSRARRPVVVVVHGGPESQAMLSFNPIVQGLVRAGYGVVVPNVRGSTGYGRRYAALDDTVKRLDSVHDLRAIHEHLATLGFDAQRAALWGGSYGGYMVLAGLAFQPELWGAGVDIVGISDLVTFLENTSDYRRAYREAEYGSLARDRAFLASASPMRRVEQIRAPLMVIHGRNDPRVPVAEAEQLAASLTARGVECTLRIYEDEGHGLARLENRLDAYPAAVAFLDRVLSAR